MSQNVDLVRGLYLPGDTDLVGVFGDDAQAMRYYDDKTEALEAAGLSE
jgi:hypothetical protein